MLVDDEIVEIVCEWDEDYIEISRNGDHELVSVKHVEPSAAVWTLATIVTDGGIRHLFDRWKKHGKGYRCRLRTNGGLNPGAGSASALKRATAGDGLAEMAMELQPRIAAKDADEAAAFIQRLTIEDELPKRDDLLPRLLTDVIPAMCDRLGWPPAEAAARFDVVRGVVRTAASADIRAVARDLSGGSGQVTATARALARKTVTRRSLSDALASVAPATTTRLVRKLERGGFLSTDIERCKRLRADWVLLEQRWTTGLPGPSAFQDARHVVQALAIDAESAAYSADEPYGPPMRIRLVEEAEQSPILLAGKALTVDQLLGAAYDETDRCNIWWSPSFDVDSPRTP